MFLALFLREKIKIKNKCDQFYAVVSIVIEENAKEEENEFSYIRHLVAPSLSATKILQAFQIDFNGHRPWLMPDVVM